MSIQLHSVDYIESLILRNLIMLLNVYVPVDTSRELSLILPHGVDTLTGKDSQHFF